MLEVDQSLVVPVCVAVISSIFAIAAVAYSKIRPHIRVQVNCWFCNENSRVLLSSKNSFVCSYCGQYNGFTKDGDYNREIPAQRMENLNLTLKGRKGSPSNLKSPIDNGLCHTCNINQALKVKSLAEFQPFMDENYDAELDTYRKRLERMFSLCRNCEGVLHQALGKQNSWIKPILMTYRLEQSRKHIYEVLASAKDVSVVSFCVKIFLLMTSLVAFLSTLYKSAVPDGYLLVQYVPSLSIVYSFGRDHLPMTCILAIFITFTWLVSHGRKFVRAVDCCCLALWSMVLGISSGSFSLEEYSNWSLQILSILTFIATVATVSKKRTVPTWKNKSVNRIELNEHDLSLYSNSDINASARSDTSYAPEPVVAEQNNPRSGSDAATAAIIPEAARDRVSRTPPLPADLSSDKSELGSTFGGLQIGTPPRKAAPNPQSFSARSLFSDRSSSQQPMLAEAKLFSRGVTQASWVAGGYWGQSGSPHKPRSVIAASELIERKIPPFSLSSRSSSHSSGFVSGRGSCATLPSRADSIVSGDSGDRCSRLSAESMSLYPRSFSDHHLHHRERFDRPASRSPPTLYDSFSRCDFPSAGLCSDSPPLNGSSDFTASFPHPSSVSTVNTTTVPPAGKGVDLLGKYCHTVVAFVLGISMTANFFLFFNNNNAKSITAAN